MPDSSLPPSSHPTAASRGLAAAAILMIVATMGSRVTGLIRTMVYSRVFGLTPEYSVFVQAFRIPDLVLFLMAGGALRTGFVPIFSEYLAHGKREQAWRVFSIVLWVLVAFGVLLVGTGMIFAPALARLVAPGFTDEQVAQCARMMRVLFPAELFFVVGGLLQGALNANKHFLWPGIGPIIYNFFLIAAGLAAPYLWGLDTVTYAVVLGAIVGNVGVQIPPLRKLGARLEFVFDIHDEGVRRVIKLALPVIAGLAVAEIVWVVITALATKVDPIQGAAIMENANRLWKLPSGIFGAGVAIALFPSLTEKYALGDVSGYRRDFSFGIRNTVFLTLPAVLVIGIMRVPIVRLLLEGGKFGPEDTLAVGSVLLWLTPGMLALAIVYILTRAFYARHEALTPVIAGISSFVACLIAAFALMPLGLNGLAMATSLSGVANVVVLMILLKKRVGPLDGRHIVASFVRSLPSNLFLAAACGLLPALVVQFVGTGGLGKLLSVVLPLGIGLTGFLVLSSVFKVDELQSAWALMRRKGRQRKPEEPSPEEADET